MARPQQLPQQMPGPLPQTAVEVDLDQLANLIELMSTGRFPDTAAKDVVQPLLYFSRLVSEATTIRMQRAAEMANPKEEQDPVPAVAGVPEAS